MQHLRKWQQDAFSSYFTDNFSRYSVTATPGAGKTTYALTIAAKMLNEGSISRIVVVAPTDHLRTQWSLAAKEFNLALDSKLGNDRMLRTGMHGYVTTYAQVAAHPVLHERRTESPNRTLVILDEVHHAGDGLSWGEAIRDAFTNSHRILTLTGTPFRTSTSEQIPFVEYEDGEEEGELKSLSNITYGYQEALNDGVVRPVVFAAYTGVARWITSAGDLLAMDLAEPLSKKQEEAAWRAVLDPEGQWVETVVTAAAQRVDELRLTTTPDAGCLFLASDQESARAYAAVIKRVTKENPVIVVSDDPNASRKISAFEKGSQKFLVAVRMVSEGVDIRRLSVLVWLTSYRTPLFFAQAVGRVLRARNNSETATVFLPSVRPLLKLAAEMETERNHVVVLAKPEATLAEDFTPTSGETGVPSVDIQRLVSTEARFAHTLVGGEAFTTNVLVNVETADGSLPGLLTQDQETLVLAAQRARERRLGGSIVVPTTQNTLLERVESIRTELTTLTRQAARRWNVTLPVAHARVRAAVSGPPTATASLEILEQRRDWLLAQVG